MDWKIFFIPEDQRGVSWTSFRLVKIPLNPILHGGALWPGRPKIVCRFHMDCAALTKFLDFVSFIVLQVSEESFSEKKIFAKNIKRRQKYPKGGPFYAKFKISKKILFFGKHYFFCLNMNCTWSQLSFEVHISSAAQNFKFLSFFPWNFQFWPSLLAWP